MNGELPEGWTVAPLDHLLEPGGLFDGPFGSSLKTSDYTASGVRVIRLENLANLRFVADKETYVSEAKYKTLTKHTVVPGDILFGSFVDGSVRVCLLPELSTKAIAKADCFTVRTRTDLADRRYVALQLGTGAVRDTFVGDIHGATRPRITTKQLRECDLAVAPLPEQRRIVEKVEALLEQVNRAKAGIERVPLILKRFRQAVLGAACSGELTKEWRSATGVDDGSWQSARTGDLCPVIQYGYTASAKSGPGPRFLRITDIQNGRVDWSQVPTCEIERNDIKKYALQAGDIVFARSGATTGKSFLITGCPPSVFASYLIRVRPGPRVSPAFLHLCFQTPEYWAYITDNMAGNAQPNCNASKLGDLEVPVPTLAEQGEIVHHVDQLFSLADAIERRVALAMARAEKLPQAILSKAFSGELVPTEADLARAEGRDYETAGELLGRLHREHVNGGGAEPRKARRTTGSKGETRQRGRRAP